MYLDLTMAERRRAVYGTAATRQHWTVADLDLLPDDEWFRYELIDGELRITEAHHAYHQQATAHICAALQLWSEEGKSGDANFQVGVVLSEQDMVIPDVVWLVAGRFRRIMNQDGHLTEAPDLIVEVLDIPKTDIRWDYENKLRLYEKYGVQEYWIVDWRAQQIEIYRQRRAQLHPIVKLSALDKLTSPLLPGFACPVAWLFD